MTSRGANKLLASLREDAYGRLAPKLVPTTLEAKQILYRPNQRIGEVYFPESCAICLMTVMHNGDTLESPTIRGMLLGRRGDFHRVASSGQATTFVLRFDKDSVRTGLYP